MLFAVEGGGFFSSSASGYSKGLTLLLLGQKNEVEPMRVTPWSQYRLVDQDPDPNLQLASDKTQPVRRCAPLVCFGCTATGLESPAPPNLGPDRNQEVSPGVAPVFDESRNLQNSSDLVVDDDDDGDGDDDSERNVVSLKSSLKKATKDREKNENETLCESNNNDVACRTERKVQWTDTIGGELFEIREFEMSEDGSDGDFGHAGEKTCSCSIM